MLAELGVIPIVFKELCLEAFGEVPESDDIPFELSLINSDQKSAKLKLVSLMNQIRHNYGLQLKRNTTLITELDEIKKVVDNEIIELNF